MARTTTGRTRTTKTASGKGYPSDEQIEAFRQWLTQRVDSMPQSRNAIEAESGIPGNALGKFLRGERGKFGLSPLNIRRLAPVIGVSEEELLARSGGLSQLPGMVPGVEAAVRADGVLGPDDKKFLLKLYATLVAAKG